LIFKEELELISKEEILDLSNSPEVISQQINTKNN